MDYYKDLKKREIITGVDFPKNIMPKMLNIRGWWIIGYIILSLDQYLIDATEIISIIKSRLFTLEAQIKKNHKGLEINGEKQI